MSEIQLRILSTDLTADIVDEVVAEVELINEVTRWRHGLEFCTRNCRNEHEEEVSSVTILLTRVELPLNSCDFSEESTLVLRDKRELSINVVSLRSARFQAMLDAQRMFETLRIAAENDHDFGRFCESEHPTVLVQAARKFLMIVAQKRWLRQIGLAELVCPQCSRVYPLADRFGRCPADNTILSMPAPKRVRCKRCSTPHCVENLPAICGCGAKVSKPKRIQTQLGKYPVHGLLGKGGFGQVLLSVPASGPPVVVKRLTRNARANPVAVSRMGRELDVLQTLSQSAPRGMMVLRDRFELNNRPVGVFKLIYGRTLHSVFSKLSTKDIVRCVVDILPALAHVHGEERKSGPTFVHRDIKPGNIMLAEEPDVPDGPVRGILIDFGLTKPPTRTIQVTCSHFFRPPKI